MGEDSNYKDVQLDPEMSALVIIDMQNDFCKPGGHLYHPDGVDEVIPKLKALLHQSRVAGMQRVFLQSVRYNHSPEYARFGQTPFIIKGTWGAEYIEAVAPLEGELVIEKNSHDCFYKTEMDSVLEKHRILPESHTIVVTGINANICVYHAVIGFHIRHYQVIVPMDCCAGYDWGRKILETQMRDNAYNYNVTLTNSKSITFKSGKD